MSDLRLEARSIRFLTLSATTALFVVACGGSGATPTVAPPTIAPSTAPASAVAAGPLTIATGTTSAGAVLTGNGGLTLYTWKNDKTPNTSACSGGCATKWPAAIVGAGMTPTAGAGVTGTLATFQRTDGTTQVSYNGAALYYFSGDTAPGDANGNGIGSVWYVATPSGSAGGSPAPSSAASPAASSAGSVHTVDLVSSAPAHLTGDKGLALYVFKKDGPSTSACTSSNCVANWPPFTVKAGESAEAGTGVAGTIATFARPDGAMQVSWNGQPLYYFAGDTKQADTNGASVSPDWSLAAPKARSGY
jgi:predicted lipoprotein with Yx(FWY)xxD motif